MNHIANILQPIATLSLLQDRYMHDKCTMRLSDGNKYPELKLLEEQGEISLGPMVNIRPECQQKHVKVILQIGYWELLEFKQAGMKM